jgi:hypothetical protein
MRLRSLAFAAPALAVLALSARADTADVEHAFLVRSAMSAADDACNLFTDGERYALKSGLYQTQNELLRANYSRERIDDAAAEERAHAKSLGCDSQIIRGVAATIRDGYRQFAKTNYIEYAGGHGIWRASRVAQDQWALSEVDKASGAILGLRRDKKKELRLAIALPVNGTPPASVKLFLRDPSLMIEPWLGSLFGGGSQLVAAPRAMTRPEWAGETAEEDDIVGDPFYVYYFSKAAVDRLEALDPREAIQLELAPNPREKNQTPTRILFEAGDFRAAHNFVLIPAPTYTPAPDAKVEAKGKHE